MGGVVVVAVVVVVVVVVVVAVEIFHGCIYVIGCEYLYSRCCGCGQEGRLEDVLEGEVDGD